MSVEETVRDVLRERAADPPDLAGVVAGMRRKSARSRLRRRWGAVALAAALVAGAGATAWAVRPGPEKAVLTPGPTGYGPRWVPDGYRETNRSRIGLAPDTKLQRAWGTGPEPADWRLEFWQETGRDLPPNTAPNTTVAGGPAYEIPGSDGATCVLMWKTTGNDRLTIYLHNQKSGACATARRVADSVVPDRRIVLVPTLVARWIPPGMRVVSYAEDKAGKACRGRIGIDKIETPTIPGPVDGATVEPGGLPEGGKALAGGARSYDSLRGHPSVVIALPDDRRIVAFSWIRTARQDTAALLKFAQNVSVTGTPACDWL